MLQQIYDLEDKKLLGMIQGSNLRILDVGCGQGRYLIPLSATHDVVGVDTSTQQVDQMRAKGFNVLHVSDELQNHGKFDYIIMSHVIEHIAPSDLIGFFNRYLALLKGNGYLIIATPLLHQGFYDDFDHIKPYTPKAIQILFSSYSQLQDRPSFQLSLVELWIRRWPYHLNQAYASCRVDKKFRHYFNRFSLNLFKATQCRIGELSGWVGKFQIFDGDKSA